MSAEIMVSHATHSENWPTQLQCASDIKAAISYECFFLNNRSRMQNAISGREAFKHFLFC